MRISSILLILFLCVSQIEGQNITSNITINYGGSVYFHFNSLSKFQTGITYTDYTEFRISYTDTTNAGAVTGSRWQLTVRPLSAQITGDGGSTIALDQLEITSKIDGVFYTTQQLIAAPIVIAGGLQTSAEEIHIITLSYACGTTPPGLMSETPDYYFIDLEFVLEKEP